MTLREEALIPRTPTSFLPCWEHLWGLLHFWDFALRHLHIARQLTASETHLVRGNPGKPSMATIWQDTQGLHLLSRRLIISSSDVMLPRLPCNPPESDEQRSTVPPTGFGLRRRLGAAARFCFRASTGHHSPSVTRHREHRRQILIWAEQNVAWEVPSLFMSGRECQSTCWRSLRCLGRRCRI